MTPAERAIMEALMQGPAVPQYADGDPRNKPPKMGAAVTSPKRVSTLGKLVNSLPGVPERLDLLNDWFNPVEAIRQSGEASQEMFAPGKHPWERVGSLGAMLTGMAGTVAPMVAASRGAMPAADAVIDGMTGFSAMPKAMAGEFALDEFGGLKMPGADDGITAYHGSPHSFDKFSMDKIGTGEGAQAYGHGLYFAENEGVARGYRDALKHKTSSVTVDGQSKAFGTSIQEADPEEIATLLSAQALTDGQSLFAASMKARNMLMKAESGDLTAFQRDAGWGDTEKMRKALGILEDWEKRDVKLVPPGSMYEVRINANPDDFLDWDKPLSEQPAKVRDWFDSRGITPGFAGNQSGAELLLAEKGVLGAEGTTSAMREASIPGIKYLDHGSRFNSTDAATNTRNYVIFDENLIEIVRKYGIAGAAAMLGVSAADVEEAMAGQ